MNDYIQVNDDKTLIRDVNSKAILSTDLKQKETFMKERDQQLNINMIKEKLDIVQLDVLEIKNMLKGILQQK